MIEKLMKRYALSEQGAKDFVKCTAITTLQNLMLMLSVAVEYYLVAVLLQGNMTGTKKVLFVLACAATLLLFLWIVYLQYNSSFFATYKESEKRRIHIAEKLRELPLSFFGKKDLSDLTSTILGDCTVLEHNFSHVMPQFFGAIISLVGEGKPMDEIAAGIELSVAKRCFVMSKKAGAVDSITLTGGCAKNDGLKEAIEKVLNLKVIDLPIDPQLMGALGAAEFARQKGMAKEGAV